MSDEENSGVFSRRKDNERRVPVATIPLPIGITCIFASCSSSVLIARVKIIDRLGEAVLGIMIIDGFVA